MFVAECRVCIVIAETPRQLDYLLVYSSLYGRSPDRHCLVGNVSGGLGCTTSNPDSAHSFKVNPGICTF